MNDQERRDLKAIERRLTQSARVTAPGTNARGMLLVLATTLGLVGGGIVAVLVGAWQPLVVGCLGVILSAGVIIACELYAQERVKRASQRVQCNRPCYSHEAGPPERCAFDEGHVGTCEP